MASTSTPSFRNISSRTPRHGAEPREFASFEDASPLGFSGGDVNLYRYVHNDAVNYTDPMGLEKRSYWEQEAKGQIGYNPGSPRHPKDILEANRRITAAYAEMYLRNPSKFVWAGMAAYASAAVGEGMCKAQELQAMAADPLVSMGTMATGAPTGTRMLMALGKGNLYVYADIYWQHLAYARGGIDEMRRLYKQGELRPELFEAWRLIDRGQVWEGNRALLRYEQSVTLQQNIYDPNKGSFDYMSWMSKMDPSTLESPIPGDPNNFQKCVPGGNIGKFEDRWDWIDRSMLPEWKRLAENSPDEVRKSMEQFIKHKFRP